MSKSEINIEQIAANINANFDAMIASPVQQTNAKTLNSIRKEFLKPQRIEALANCGIDNYDSVLNQFKSIQPTSKSHYLASKACQKIYNLAAVIATGEVSNMKTNVFAILTNLIFSKTGKLSNVEKHASLQASLEVGYELPEQFHRLHKAESSSRSMSCNISQAFHALGLAHYDSPNHVLTVDRQSPVYKKIAPMIRKYVKDRNES